MTLRSILLDFNISDGLRHFLKLSDILSKSDIIFKASVNFACYGLQSTHLCTGVILVRKFVKPPAV